MSPSEAAALLRNQDNLLLLTHRRPDGDTIGCATGLCAALRQLGKTAYLLPNSDATETVALYAQPYWAPEDFSPDYVVSVDVSSRGLFPPNAEPYIERIGLAVDHHLSFDGFGAHQCLQPDKAACGEIVYEICLALGEITPAVALPLYAAVATDTGCFVYANTTANTHRVAAALMETGIDFYAVNKRHFRTKTRKRVALEAALFQSAEFFHEGRGAFFVAPLSLLQEIGADERDAEDLSTISTVIEGMDCGVTLKESEPGRWKLSLRTGANGRVNAMKACALLGGGGHAMAAGAILEGTLEEVKARILAAIDQVKAY